MRSGGDGLGERSGAGARRQARHADAELVVDYDGLEHVAEVHRTWYGKSFSTMEFEADESIKL